MDGRRPNTTLAPLPFLESISRTKARNKTEEDSPSKAKSHPTKISKYIKADAVRTNQNVNFGRAFGIRPLEEQERQDRPITAISRKSVDQILGSSIRQPDGSLMPKRRTINEILSRSGQVNQTKVHVSKVKRVEGPVKPLKRAADGNKPPTAQSRSVVQFAAVETGQSSNHLDHYASKKELERGTATLGIKSSSKGGASSDEEYRPQPPKTESSVGIIKPNWRFFIDFSKAEVVEVGEPEEEEKQQAKTELDEALKQIVWPNIGRSANMTLLKFNDLGEEFRQRVSKPNTRMVRTQTQRAERYDEGVQTDPIVYKRKWTQEPVRFLIRDENKVAVPDAIIKAQSVGAGPDSEDDGPISSNEDKGQMTAVETSWQMDSAESLAYDGISISETQKLERFIGPAMNLMLHALQTVNPVELETSDQKTHYVLDAACTETDSQITVVSCDGEEVAVACVETNSGDRNLNMITVWDTRRPALPLYTLKAWGIVTQLKMCQRAGLVIAGTQNGALAIFSTGDPETFLPLVDGRRVRGASIYTGGMEPSHILPILGLEVLPEQSFSAQIFSMDRTSIIWWSCIHYPEVDKESKAAAHSPFWSSVRLRVVQSVNLPAHLCQAEFVGRCFKVWQEFELNFIAGSSSGYVARGKITPPDARKTSYLHYLLSPKDKENNPIVRTLDLNLPMGIYAASAIDDFCWLGDLDRDRILTRLCCNGRPRKVLWSRKRHTVLYVCLADEIDVWDLAVSHKTPVTSMAFLGIVDFDIMDSDGKERLVIVANDGKSLIIESLRKCNTSPLTYAENTKCKRYIGSIS